MDIEAYNFVDRAKDLVNGTNLLLILKEHRRIELSHLLALELLVNGLVVGCRVDENGELWTNIISLVACN